RSKAETSPSSLHATTPYVKDLVSGMEAFSRRVEAEKLAELEAMLNDASNGGQTGDSFSFISEASTSAKVHLPDTQCHVSWRGNSESTREVWTGDLTTPINAAIPSTCSPEVRRGDHMQRFRRQNNKVEDKLHVKCEEELATLRAELISTRSQLQQKEVVARSLQRQLQQREVVERQTLAHTEEGLVAALARETTLKEQLAQASQSVVDGALMRQRLEDRIAALKQDLLEAESQQAIAHKDLEGTRAEVARLSATLHSRRGTDVVEAELAFGEEVQRLQEKAALETATLREEVTTLRLGLERRAVAFRQACTDRDACREEADTLSKEVQTLRETMTALRQYNESDAIDHLLEKVATWKARAEELEDSMNNMDTTNNREKVVSGELFHDENEETREDLDPDRWGHSIQEGDRDDGTKEMALDQEPTGGSRGQSEIEPQHLVQGHSVALQQVEELQQELAQAKEAVTMLTEDRDGALMLRVEEVQRRCATEARVKALEGMVSAAEVAAQKTASLKKASKVKAMEDLKSAIRVEMGAELERLRFQLEEESRAEVEKYVSALAGTPTCDHTQHSSGEKQGQESSPGSSTFQHAEAYQSAVADLFALVEGPLQSLLEEFDIPSGIVGTHKSLSGAPIVQSVGNKSPATKGLTGSPYKTTETLGGLFFSPGCAEEVEVRLALQARVEQIVHSFRAKLSGLIAGEVDAEAQADLASSHSRSTGAGSIKNEGHTLATCQSLDLSEAHDGEPGGVDCGEQSGVEVELTVGLTEDSLRLEGVGRKDGVDASALKNEGLESCSEGMVVEGLGHGFDNEGTVNLGWAEGGPGCCDCTRQENEGWGVETVGKGRPLELEEALRGFEREKAGLVQSLMLNFEQEKVKELNKQRLYFEFHIQELNGCIMEMIQEVSTV
ncbi:unnamed protein product, partial [Discosporangium mesarthrocarpum]